MTDPRASIIDERLKNIRRILAISSGKGGVGKSLVATTLALTLSKRGCKVGLLDIDFTSPTTHIILGAPNNLEPTEDKGLVPPSLCGLEYMSLIYYTLDKPAPLRGHDISNILLELLAVTRWSKLDYLIIDMPPGIGDAVLDIVRLITNVEFVIVTTPSQLAFETVRKLANLLSELHISVVGVIENMRMNEQSGISRRTDQLNLRFLGAIPFDARIEEAIGKPSKLLETAIGGKIREIVMQNLEGNDKS